MAFHRKSKSFYSLAVFRLIGGLLIIISTACIPLGHYEEKKPPHSRAKPMQSETIRYLMIVDQDQLNLLTRTKHVPGNGSSPQRKNTNTGSSTNTDSSTNTGPPPPAAGQIKDPGAGTDVSPSDIQRAIQNTGGARSATFQSATSITDSVLVGHDGVRTLVVGDALAVHKADNTLAKSGSSLTLTISTKESVTFANHAPSQVAQALSQRQLVVATVEDRSAHPPLPSLMRQVMMPRIREIGLAQKEARDASEQAANQLKKLIKMNEQHKITDEQLEQQAAPLEAADQANFTNCHSTADMLIGLLARNRSLNLDPRHVFITGDTSSDARALFLSQIRRNATDNQLHLYVMQFSHDKGSPDNSHSWIVIQQGDSLIHLQSNSGTPTDSYSLDDWLGKKTPSEDAAAAHSRLGSGQAITVEGYLSLMQMGFATGNLAPITGIDTGRSTDYAFAWTEVSLRQGLDQPIPTATIVAEARRAKIGQGGVLEKFGNAVRAR